MHCCTFCLSRFCEVITELQVPRPVLQSTAISIYGKSSSHLLHFIKTKRSLLLGAVRPYADFIGIACVNCTVVLESQVGRWLWQEMRLADTLEALWQKEKNKARQNPPLSWKHHTLGMTKPTACAPWYSHKQVRVTLSSTPLLTCFFVYIGGWNEMKMLLRKLKK